MGLAQENQPDMNYPDSLKDQADISSANVIALRERLNQAENVVLHQSVLVNQLAEILSASSFETAMDAMVNALQLQFDCTRVAVSTLSDGMLKLQAVSQQAVFQSETSEAQLMLDAMQEACDQESIVNFPSVEPELGVLLAHRSLAGPNSQKQICSVPLYVKDELIGAFLLERDNAQSFPSKTLNHLSVCIAPLIELRREADSSVLRVAKNRLKKRIKSSLGVEKPGSKLLLLAVVGAIAAATFIPVNWHVRGEAELLPSERRLVTAAHSGFIEETLVAAGQGVEAGQLLARMDNRELELALASRESEVAVAEAEFRAAMASYDRQATGIARARLAQARARRDTVMQQLDRTQLHAPIDGLVIAADPSRTSGAAVTRGETLFEIAPNDDYEVHILVDESDVHDVFSGQVGELALRSNPGETVKVVVNAIHPVAETANGASQFRVRATMTEPDASLRPGQSGVARLHGGTSNALGAWTRKLSQRLSELWWRFVG